MNTKVRKHSGEYSLAIGSDLLVFFDRWEFVSPDSSSSTSEYIGLIHNNDTIAMITGGEMKEVQAQLNDIK